MSGQTDPWPEYCRRLNKHYCQGNLRILAGAGLSVDSGFPSWPELNRGLLTKYIAEDLGRDPKAWPVIGAHLDELVHELYETIGRDAASEFVWNSSTRENFFEDLRQLLYEGRQLCDLPLTHVHWQLASLAATPIFTTNFDPLLELARYRVSGGNAADPDLSPFRSANPPPYGVTPDPARIYHVHGWIDPDGICGGSFVLTESQYFELFSRQGQRPNQMLDYVLTAGGAVLVLGMSLADVNLRRHLYLRSNNRISDSTEIYAVVRGRGSRLLDMYQTLHWANRGVRLIYVDDYEDIPRLLREVKFGLQPGPSGATPWMEESYRVIQEVLPARQVFSDPWQKDTRHTFKDLIHGFRESFAVGQNETVHLGLMGQITPAHLALFCDTRHVWTGEQALRQSESFRLRLTPDRPEGVAGVAFSTGELNEVRDNPAVADQNLSAEMKAFYASKGVRHWRSLLAVPVLWTADRLPIVVAVVSSNLAEPFWAKFGDKQETYLRELSKAIGLIVREVIERTAQLTETNAPEISTMKAQH